MNTKRIFGSLALAAWLACSGSLLADPLNNWHWRNPSPNGNPAIGPNAVSSVIFTNGQFFGVGASGTVATSPDGKFWVENISATTNQLTDIIYANGLFVAVGTNGTVETSPDGTNWTLQSSGTASTLSSVAYGNGRYCAVGSAIITSADGISWSLSPTLLRVSAVAGNSTGFVAVNGGTNAYFSTDGRTWTTNDLTVPVTGYFGNTLQAEIVTATGTNFIIGSFIYVTSGSGDMFMFTSPDGTHWAANALGNIITMTAGFGYNCFINGGSELIANGYAINSFLQFSTNGGVTWSMTSISASILHTRAPYAGAYGNGNYFLTSSYGSSFFSPDSLNWTELQSLPAGPLSTFYSIASSNGTNVVATSSSFVVSTNDAVYTIASNTPSLSSVAVAGITFFSVGPGGQIYRSGDGVSWTSMTSNTTNNLHGVAVGNLGLVVAVGDNGTIQTYSPLAPPFFVSQTSGTALSLNSVVYSNGLYVVVGQQGTILTSPDGATWTARSSGVISNLLAVTYGPAGFLAAGANGTILTSLNGVNWTQQNSSTSATLESASAGNGYYLVAGNNATVLTSYDGVNWTPRNVGATGGQTFYGSGFLNGRFDIVGAFGNILESDVVPQIFNLQVKAVPPKDVVTAFVVPGSNFRILSSTNLTGPGWTTAATFNSAAAITYWTNSLGAYSFYRLVSP